MASNSFNISAQLDLTQFLDSMKQMLNIIISTQRRINKTGFGKVLDKKALEDLAKYEQSLDRTSEKLKKVKEEQEVVNDKLKKGGRRATGFSNAIKDVGRRVFIWGSLSAAIFGTIHAIKDAVKATIEFEAALVNLRKVLPRETDFDFLRGRVFDLSVEFGSRPEDALEILRRFAQSGLNAADALQSTRAALLAINTTGADTADAINGLIAANRVFKVSFNDMARVIDKVQRVQADFAVDAKDLINAIPAIGPAFANLGGDIDDLFGTIGAMGEAARISGREAANSMKRVLAKMVSKDGIKALQDFGVQVFATADKFRSLRDILKDLGVQYQKATPVQRQHIAMVLAQVRQYAKFTALLGNFDRYLLASEKSQLAFNDAVRANQYVMNTFEKRLQVSSNQMRRFSDDFMRGGIVEGLINFKGVIGSITEILTPFAPMLGKVTFYTTSLLAVVTAATLAFKGFAWAVIAVSKTSINATLAKVSAAFGATTAAARVATTAVRTFYITTGLLGIGLVAAGLAWSYFDQKGKETERVLKSMSDTVDDFRRSLDDIDFGFFSEGLVSEQKFDKTMDFIHSFVSDIDKGIEKSQALENALKDVFNISGPKGTEETLAKIMEAVERVTALHRQIVPEIFNESIAPVFESINKGLSVQEKILKSLSTSRISTSYETGALIGAGDLTKKEALLFGEYKERNIGEGDATGNMVDAYVSLKKLGDSEYFTATNKQIEESEKKVQGLVQEIKELQKTLLKQKGVAAPTIEIGETKDQISNKYEEIADNITKYYDVAGIARKAAENLATAMGKRIDDPFASIQERAQEMVRARLFDEVNEIFKDLTKNLGLTAEQAKEATDELKKLMTSGGLSGFEKVELNITQMVKSIDTLNDVIVAGFSVQRNAIDKVKDAFGDLSNTFSSTSDALRLVDTTIKSVTSNMGAQAGAVKRLQIEEKFLTRTLAEAIDTTGKKAGAFDQDIETMKNRLNKIQAELKTLNAAVKINEETWENLSGVLIKTFKVYDRLDSIEKNRIMLVNKQVEMQKELADGLRDLNEIVNADSSSRTFAVNKEIERDILDIEMQRIDAMLELNELSERKAADAKLEAIANYNVNDTLLTQKYLLEEIEKEYEDIDSMLDMIGSTVEDLLADQKNYFDFLSGSKSGLQFLGDSFGGLTESFMKQNAEKIAKALNLGLKSGLEKQNDRLQELIRQLKNLGTESDLKSSLEETGENFGRSVRESIIDAFQVAHEEVLQHIPELIKSGLLPMAEGFDLMVRRLVNDILDLKRGENIDETSEKPFLPEVAKSLTEGGIGSSDEVVDLTPLVEAQLVSDEKFEENISRFVPIIAGGFAGTWNKLDILKTAVDIAGDKSEKSGDNVWEALLHQGIMMGGQAIGAQLGGSAANVQTGSNIGSAAGFLLGTQVLTSIGGPLGMALGAGLGGILGGLFGEDDKVEEQTNVLQRIEDNTAKMVDRLSPEIINAPSTFTIPSVRGGASSVTVQNNFTINSSDTGPIMRTLETQLNDLYNRTTRNRSVLG